MVGGVIDAGIVFQLGGEDDVATRYARLFPNCSVGFALILVPLWVLIGLLRDNAKC